MARGEKHQPIRVLLVEDSPTDVLLVRAALGVVAGAKFDVASVERLETAFERAQSVPVDVLLLDLGLPDSQGLETFVRAHAALPGLPIVVLSGQGDEELALLAVQQGAQDYLVKRATMKELLPRAIRYAVERHQAGQKLAHYARELGIKNAALEEEFRIAREVQQALLPRRYPQFSNAARLHGCALQFAHRYCPAARLSGDFFHIMPLSDHQVGVLICDVMGHGVRAAFLGALARGFILHSTPLASDPGEFLTALNRELAATLKQIEIDAFATAFYYVADLAAQRVSYANAGHPSPLILRRATGQVDWLRVEKLHQPPLGLFSTTTYRTSQTALAERDSIVLFTDGLYEQENAAGTQFGRERLLAAVQRRAEHQCGTLLDELVNETQHFSGQEEFDDDVCLVGMDVVRSPQPTVASR